MEQVRRLTLREENYTNRQNWYRRHRKIRVIAEWKGWIIKLEMALVLRRRHCMNLPRRRVPLPLRRENMVLVRPLPLKMEKIRSLLRVLPLKRPKRRDRFRRTRVMRLSVLKHREKWSPLMNWILSKPLLLDPWKVKLLIVNLTQQGKGQRIEHVSWILLFVRTLILLCLS